MPLWVKGYNGFVPAQKIWVKGYSGFTAVKKVWVKTANNIWQQFYPKLGPFTDTPPSLTSDSAGTTFPVYVYMGSIPNPAAVPSSTNVYVPRVLYSHTGDWRPNGYTLSSFTWQFNGSSTPTGSPITTITSTTNLTLASSSVFPGDYTAASEINLSLNSVHDAQYWQYQVTANTTTSGVSSIDTSDSYNQPRIFVVKNPPVLITGTNYITGTVAIGSTLSYGSSWQSAEGYSPVAARTTVNWYRSDGYLLQSGSYSYVIGSIATGYGIYVVETVYNSGTDYLYGTSTGVSATSPTTSPVITTPSISASGTTDGSGLINITISTAPSGYTYYIRYLRTDGGAHAYQYKSVSSPTTSLSVNAGDIVLGATYTVGVAYVLSGNIGPYSNAVAGLQAAVGPAYIPTLTGPYGQNDGMYVVITNYDASYTWSVAGSGTFTFGFFPTLVGGQWQASLTGMGYGGTATITVYAAKTNYATGSASLTGRSLPGAPSFSPYYGTGSGSTSTAQGYMFINCSGADSVSFTVYRTGTGTGVTGYGTGTWTLYTSGSQTTPALYLFPINGYYYISAYGVNTYGSQVNNGSVQYSDLITRNWFWGATTTPPPPPPPVLPPPVLPPPVLPPPVLPPPVLPPKLPPNIPVTPPTVPALPTVPAVPTVIPQPKSPDWWKGQG
jgi:hypothetical protein